MTMHLQKQVLMDILLFRARPTSYNPYTVAEELANSATCWKYPITVIPTKHKTHTIPGCSG